MIKFKLNLSKIEQSDTELLGCRTYLQTFLLGDGAAFVRSETMLHTCKSKCGRKAPMIVLRNFHIWRSSLHPTPRTQHCDT